MWFYSYHSLSTHFSSQFYLTFWQALSTIFAHLLCCAFVKCQVCKKNKKKTINTLHIYFKYRKLWYFDFLQAGKKGQRKKYFAWIFYVSILENELCACCLRVSKPGKRETKNTSTGFGSINRLPGNNCCFAVDKRKSFMSVLCNKYSFIPQAVFQ